MNVICKAMPGRDADYRLMFTPRPGARPVAEIRITGSEPLKSFLMEKLEVQSARAGRVVNELETSGNSWLEGLPATEPELKLAIRTFETELAEAK